MRGILMPLCFSDNNISCCIISATSEEAEQFIILRDQNSFNVMSGRGEHCGTAAAILRGENRHY